MSSPLQNNITNLQELLEQINNLPEEVTLPDLTNPADASKALSGYEFINEDGEKVTGTIPTKTASDLTASGATITVPSGYYATQATKSVTTATQATPSVSIDSAGKITATATQTAGYVTAGTKSGTKQLTTQAAKTITPTKSSQTAVASGVYTTGTVTVGAIPSQYVDNSSVTAVESDVMSGKKFGANGSVKTGTFSLDTELTAQDSLISQIQTALQNKAAATGEDVTSETTAYTNKLATLETAITALETELQGKASGGSGGGNLETCTVDLSSAYDWELDYIRYSDGNEVVDFGPPSNVYDRINLTVVKNTMLLIFSFNFLDGVTIVGDAEIVFGGRGNRYVLLSINDDCSIDIYNGSEPM